VAVVFYGRKITFGELRERVDRFAAALAHLGVRKGDRVVFLMLNSPEHIVAYYGVMKVGGIIVSVSPVYVSSEILHQVNDSGAETAICNDMLYPGLEKTGAKLKRVILTNISESLPRIKKFLGRSLLREVYQKMALPPPDIYEREGVYQLQELLRSHPPTPPAIRVEPDDCVSLQYTGGTTGAPKGVMISHRNLISYSTQFQAFMPFLRAGERWLAYLPFYHAGGQVLAIVHGIIQGYTLIVITTPDIDTILRAIVKHKIGCFLGVPSIFETLKDYKKTDLVDWKRLKVVISGMDTLHESTEREWKERTGVSLHNGYGMTELTAATHMTPLGGGRPGSIGVPITNVVAAILDPDSDAFVPVGELGEISVKRSPQVTQGYWNNPEATRDCEATIDGEVWWRTGDLGRMDEDGYFYVYDRKRDLIKYKGLRVYAREVEEVLKDHPQIREVGVVGVPDLKVGENVKAFVVLEPDARGKLSETDIMEHCQGKLAPYKVPRIVQFVGEIPKTDVGKVSRRELREGAV
jgi:long-chain acyl-CoA synthetase